GAGAVPVAEHRPVRNVAVLRDGDVVRLDVERTENIARVRQSNVATALGRAGRIIGHQLHDLGRVDTRRPGRTYVGDGVRGGGIAGVDSDGRRRAVGRAARSDDVERPQDVIRVIEIDRIGAGVERGGPDHRPCAPLSQAPVVAGIDYIDGAGAGGPSVELGESERAQIV